MFNSVIRKIYLLIILTTLALSFPPLLQGISEPQISQQIATAEKNKICLTMIVKNESKIIKRCLNSVKDIIDCISICDTGSSDNTKAIIEQFMKEHQIPGKVHEHPWKNFGHNRTLAAQAARETLTEMGFPLANTYLLLLDADMLLKIEPEFRKHDLTADMYLMTQKNGALSYANTRLVRASLPWECIGVTHEYWTCKTPKQDAKIEALWIDDHNDGGCKSDKFERDIKLLTQGLKEEPDNERYMFYLAQSYKCLGQLDEAIRWYKARIQKGGWKEEVWYSQLMIGEAYENLEFWDQALHWYLTAYECNPARAEPLQKIASHYRFEGKNDLAYLFAKHGSRIPYPINQFLFISDPVYDYQFDEEISIAGYYTPGHKDEGFQAADHLVLKKKIPSNVKEQAHKNLLFYVQNIKYAKLQTIEFELPVLRAGSNERFYSSTPTIQKWTDGYDVICRTVNYTQKGGMGYASRDDQDATIRTRNFLLRYDRNFNLLSQKEIIEESPNQAKKFNVVGLEDCRLIALDNNRWFLATTYDTHPTIGQTLCKLASPSDHVIELEKKLPLQGPDPKQCEKNWLPFAKDNELYIIYGYNPFTIYKVNKDSGLYEIVIQYEPPYDFSHFRGSAPPIEFDDGYLFLIHEVVFNPQRHYIHRLVYLDKNFHIERVSRPFTFLHNGIEYCCGMTMNHAGTQCLMAISYEDQKSYLVSVDLDMIRSLLKPLP